jgi:hypothetical protein
MIRTGRLYATDTFHHDHTSSTSLRRLDWNDRMTLPSCRLIDDPGSDNTNIQEDLLIFDCVTYGLHVLCWNHFGR